MVFKLYFSDPFTGKRVARFEYKKFKELKTAWTAPENSNYILDATEEKKVTNLPPRPRKRWDGELENSLDIQS